MSASYDARTALVVVDVQNDFADPAGALFVAGGPAVVAASNHEIRAALSAGAPVVYTQDWHPPSTPHFVTEGGIWPVHCVRGTWGAAFHPDLIVEGPIVRNGTGDEDGYSGFTTRNPTTGVEAPTELDDLLRDRGVEGVVVIGLALDYCVKETALDARKLGYECTVLRDATAPVDVHPGDGERAVEELVAAGVVIG